MQVKSATFTKSSFKIEQCPKEDMPEYAFIGRSNVGKSSLINMLTDRKALAKISGKPGKTQLINHFLINDNWYLVDLPGYGYAKVSIKDRDKWNVFTKRYLLERMNLMCLFVLVDSRHEPQKIDLEFMEMLGINGIPFSIIFTKTDKITSNQAVKNISNYKEKLLETWEELPNLFQTSSTQKKGGEEILTFIEETNKLFNLP